MMRSWIAGITCLIFIGGSWGCFAQKRTDLQSPLDIPLNLSGNFGEFRTNHFHSGLDIKTQGREGLPVYASGHGFVSRIKVSAFGYGNALYIDHPNGYTTVYAHLHEFNEEITAFLRKAQYDLESFEVDLNPGKDQILISTHEEIGKSGNSGSSGGPHLHFEIRQTATEFPVNPLLWDFPVADHRAPLIHELTVYPLSDSSFVEGSSYSMGFASARNSGACALLRSEPIGVTGPIGMGIHTLDLLDGNSNSCGIYRLEMYLDDSLVVEQVMNQLDFGTNRFLNAHADYEVLKKQKKSIHKTYVLPFNNLTIYKNLKNRGVIILEDDEVHQLRFVVEDVHGNASTLTTQIIRSDEKRKEDLIKAQHDIEKEFKYDRVNALCSEACNVFMPPGRIYEDALCWADKKDSLKGYYSFSYEIGDYYVPIHEPFLISLKISEVPDSLKSKLLVVRKGPGSREYAQGGRFKLGWVETRVKSFGTYYVALDDVAPVIQKIDLSSNMKGKSNIKVKATDNLSGIQEYRATINNQWILMEYDAKRALFTYSFDSSKLAHGKHDFRFEVIDERGNQASLEQQFEW
jgi:hypothetical protein